MVEPTQSARPSIVSKTLPSRASKPVVKLIQVKLNYETIRVSPAARVSTTAFYGLPIKPSAHRAGNYRKRPTGPAALRKQLYAPFTSIFFCCFCASCVFGSVSVRTPFENSAAILSRSMPSGRAKLRWNAP